MNITQHRTRSLRCKRRLRPTAQMVVTVAAFGAILTGMALPAAGQLAGRPGSSRSAIIFGNIAVSSARVWVFAEQARSSGPGSVVELSPATGRQLGTLRERKPGQTPWFAAAYLNHPWTTIVKPDGGPALAEVSASGAFTHVLNLASDVTPDGPVAGAVALAGRHLWAAAAASDGTTRLVEVSASNGTRIRLLRWSRVLRGFSPVGMAVSGPQIWMTDGQCEVARVTISTDQARIFRLPARDCQLGRLPAQISASGQDVWVEAFDNSVSNDGLVAELNARNGRLVRLISGRKYGWDTPSFIVTGPDLWVTSQTGGYHGNGSVTELNASTGRLVHFFSARKYHFDQPFAITAWGRHVWVLNLHSVTKL